MGKLEQIYLFKDISTTDLNELNKIVIEKHYTAGQDIFVSGQEAHSMYMINMGTVKIVGKDDSSIATLGNGSHFGEMAFLDHGKRSATAQAIESSTVSEISYSDLKNLVNKNPSFGALFYRNLAGYLAGRLRATNENLETLKELRLKSF